MPIRGWIYIITNKSMRGLVKIGYSTKDPALRSKELDNTGVPHKYSIVYDILVNEPRDYEKKIHSFLHDKHEGKEWFKCSEIEAIKAIRKIVGSNILIEKVELPYREQLS